LPDREVLLLPLIFQAFFFPGLRGLPTEVMPLFNPVASAALAISILRQKL